ncbi:MAG: hypothetical protein NWQ32_15405, partial [Paracoccaceae bacterium]|nr:hypothetical protein [Paracoccaceae bacterium]
MSFTCVPFVWSGMRPACCSCSKTAWGRILKDQAGKPAFETGLFVQILCVLTLLSNYCAKQKALSRVARVNICPSHRYIRQNNRCRAEQSMSDSGRRKPPLVADRRVGAKKASPAAKTSASKPSKPTARKSAPRRTGKRRNPIVALFAGLFGWFWRIVWGFTWRVGLITALILA